MARSPFQRAQEHSDEPSLQVGPQEGLDPKVVWNDFNLYSQAKRGEVRARAVENFNQYALQNPLEALKVLQEWDLAITTHANTPEHEDTVKKLRSFLQALEQKIAKTESQAVLDVSNDTFERLLEASVHGPNPNYTQLLLAKLTATPETLSPEIRTSEARWCDIKYRAAEWALRNGDEPSIEFALRFCMADETVFDPQTAISLTGATLCALYSNNNETLARNYEIDNFVAMLAPVYSPQGWKNFHDRLKIVADTETEKLRAIKKQDPRRFKKLTDFYESAVDTRGLLTIPEELETTFPYQLFTTHSGFVRTATLIKYAELKGAELGLKLTAFPDTTYLQQLGRSETGLSAEYVGNGFKRAEKPSLHNAQALTELQAATLLGYVHPELSLDQTRELILLANELKTDLAIKPIRGVSPEGDVMLLSDPTLVELGYRAVGFSVLSSDNPRETRALDVYLFYGPYAVVLTMDRSFKIASASGAELTKPPLSLPFGTTKYFEVVALCHLRELMCSETYDPDREEITSLSPLAISAELHQEPGALEQPQLLELGARFSRRAHRRLLPAGQKPSAKQIELGLQSFIDIERINREKVAQGEGDRLYTFVKKVEDEGSNQAFNPVYSKATSKAMAKVNEVLGS